MLIRFQASNHRSIKSPIELSMVAVDRDRSSVRTFERLAEGLVPIAAIYGPNASGKTNVLDSLRWLSAAVRDSLRAWDYRVPREPFRSREFMREPSRFELDLMVEGVRYTYRLEVGDEEVLYEDLVSYPQKKPRTLIVREGMELTLRRGLSGLTGVRELLTPVTLALSAARRFDVDDVVPAARAIASISALSSRRRSAGGTQVGAGRYGPAWSAVPATSGLFIDAHRTGVDDDVLAPRDSAPAEKSAAIGLLKFADFGIEGVEVVEQQDASADRPRLDLRFVHRVDDEPVVFQLQEESDGTQAWFQLIGPTLAALRNGHILLLDEIDASLHPLLSAQLLDLFRNPRTNPRGAQLIFTTHDTTLLGELNRDEVWLTEKGRSGATTLTAIAEFGGDRVRRSLNLERAYLQGRFGGLPDLDESRLLDTVAEDSESGDESTK